MFCEHWPEDRATLSFGHLPEIKCHGCPFAMGDEVQPYWMVTTMPWPIIGYTPAHCLDRHEAAPCEAASALQTGLSDRAPSGSWGGLTWEPQSGSEDQLPTPNEFKLDITFSFDRELLQTEVVTHRAQYIRDDLPRMPNLASWWGALIANESMETMDWVYSTRLLFEASDSIFGQTALHLGSYNPARSSFTLPIRVPTDTPSLISRAYRNLFHFANMFVRCGEVSKMPLPEDAGSSAGPPTVRPRVLYQLNPPSNGREPDIETFVDASISYDGGLLNDASRAYRLRKILYRHIPTMSPEDIVTLIDTVSELRGLTLSIDFMLDHIHFSANLDRFGVSTEGGKLSPGLKDLLITIANDLHRKIARFYVVSNGDQFLLFKLVDANRIVVSPIFGRALASIRRAIIKGARRRTEGSGLKAADFVNKNISVLSVLTTIMYPLVGKEEVRPSDFVDWGMRRQRAAPEAGRRAWLSSCDLVSSPPAGIGASSIGDGAQGRPQGPPRAHVYSREFTVLHGSHTRVKLSDLPYASWQCLVPDESVVPQRVERFPFKTYEITAYVASGRTFDVYRAVDKSFSAGEDQTVVLKICNLDTFEEYVPRKRRRVASDCTESFRPYTRNEAEQAVALEDALYRGRLRPLQPTADELGFVPRYHGTWCSGALRMIVLEDIGDLSLETDMPAHDDPFRETLALRVKENFAALHAEGVLHRDVQRRHILLRPNDVPVTIDFEGAIETSDQALFEEEDRQVDRLFDLDDQE